MTRPPRLKGKQIVRAFEKAGFQAERSGQQFRGPAHERPHFLFFR